jgi:hypothetical protein
LTEIARRVDVLKFRVAEQRWPMPAPPRALAGPMTRYAHTAAITALRAAHFCIASWRRSSGRRAMRRLRSPITARLSISIRLTLAR